jgi:hypothetical protein
MFKPRRRLRARVLLLSTLPLLVPGCDQRPTPPTQVPTQQPAVPEHTYTVRGQVVALPTPTSSLQIRHEAIPDFVRKDGSKGMNAMIMGFPTAQGVSLRELAPGDKVEFVLEVWLNPKMRYQISRISKLPAEPPSDVGGTP